MPHGVYIPVLIMRQTHFETSLKFKLVLNPQNTNFRSEAIQILLLGISSMPMTKKKQKKARKSRGLELL